MAGTRTFLDANILINAFRGSGTLARDAQDLVDDPAREFIASDVLRLELLPKAHYHGHTAEVEFYEAYFAAARSFVETTPELVREAEAAAKAFGLSAADSPHVTAARHAGAREFITAERTTKPIFRVEDLTVISIRR